MLREGDKLHIWAKFSDDWPTTATCIVENVPIKKIEYRRPTLTTRYDIMSDVTSVKILFM